MDLKDASFKTIKEKREAKLSKNKAQEYINSQYLIMSLHNCYDWNIYTTLYQYFRLIS